MKIRFGYVAIALGVPEGSPNKTVTVKTLEKIADPEGRLHRLRRITRNNLATTLRILRYNAAIGIQVYRFTSKTVPLATHALSTGWDYIGEFREEWREIGDYLRGHHIRVSAHPDHYTLLNSPQAEVVAASMRDLEYHAAVFAAMGLERAPQLVMHVGGIYRDRETSLARFTGQFAQLPTRISDRLMLENDDRIYGAGEVLALCRQIGRPMVLDIHHHACLNRQERLVELWPQIAATWGTTTPKVHISSPRSTKDVRSHADFVNADDFLPFLQAAKELNADFDVMVEAKQKDVAMLQLVHDLAKVAGIRRIGPAMLEY